MDSSRSIRRGQFPSFCKLCAVETRLSWKCLDCDILMCAKCKETIHPNLKNARKHKIINIKEIGLITEEIDFNNIPCKSHEGELCVMFCKSCDRLVCTKCVLKIHNGHKMMEIGEGYQCKIQIFQERQERIKSEKLANKKSKIKEIKKAENAKYMEIKKRIQAHNISLKREVDRYTEILLKELDQTWITLLKSIEREESTLMEKTMTDRDIEDVLETIDVEKIFEMGKEVETSVGEAMELLMYDFPSVPSFIPGDISPYNVGVLQQSTDIKLRPIKEYSTDISFVVHMAASKDSLFISDQEVVQNVKPDERTLKVISSFDIEIMDMAVTPSGDLLLAPRGQSVLKQISSTTNKLTNTNYSVHPLTLTAVHVTSDGKVAMGAMNYGDPFPVTGRRAVISMDRDGRNKTIYEYDRNNQRTFTYPRMITSTKSGNFCVVDVLSNDGRRRVVVLGQGGDIINIYTGHLDVNTTDNPFKPVSIVTTPSDKIIVSDLDTHSLHILNNKGQPVVCIKTKDKGIEYPYSITFTTQGRVYIGCSTAIGSTVKAKLYEVKLLE